MNSGQEAGAAPAAVAQNLDADGTIEGWRRQGADRFDPVRFRFIEELARRAAAHGGATRRVLDARLAQLLANYGADVESCACAMSDSVERSAATPTATAPESGSRRGPLTALLDHVAHSTWTLEGNVAALGLERSAGPTAELRTVRHFRSTWDRLNTQQRLTASLAQVPENAGPLNSQRLVHRALTLMRELSPEYLSRFAAYVDTLLWIDQATGGDSAETKTAAHRRGERRSASRRTTRS